MRSFYLFGGDPIGPAECAYGDRIVVLRAVAPVIDGPFSIGISSEPGELYYTIGPAKKTLGYAIKVCDERRGNGLGKRAACGGHTRDGSGDRFPESIPVVVDQGIGPAGCPHPVVAAIESDPCTIGISNFKIGQGANRYVGAIR